MTDCWGAQSAVRDGLQYPLPAHVWVPGHAAEPPQLQRPLVSMGSKQVPWLMGWQTWPLAHARPQPPQSVVEIVRSLQLPLQQRAADVAPQLVPSGCSG